MITVKSTARCTGVTVSGDCRDIDALYEAMHEVVGGEGEYAAYGAARIRVLGICYDLRHALMGDREVELVDNGMDKEMMKRLNVISSDRNVYYGVQVLWPEMLFVLMALNDFVRLHTAKLTKKHYSGLLHKNAIWNPAIASVRQFQSAILKEIEAVVTPPAFVRMVNTMVKDYTWFDYYTTQYVDVLNVDWIAATEEKRAKGLSTVAKRFAERGDAYMNLRAQVKTAALHHQTHEEDISAPADYPDTIEW